MADGADNGEDPVEQEPARVATEARYGLQLVTLRMHHHAAASGYHRLADALPAEHIRARAPTRLTSRVAMKLLSPAIKRSGSQWYNRVSLAGELAAGRRWLQSRSQVFHFLYGENSYRYLGALKTIGNRGHRLVATYHTPAWRMAELVHDTEHIKRLDAVVVVSTIQRAYFARLLGRERVYYVPHGIDTDFYTPAPRGNPEDDTFRFVCVGHHLRDFPTLAAAADILWQRDRSIEIVVVSDPGRLGALAPLPNVRHLSGINDEQLRSLYQQSNALLLPLLDATANNALLEGMACGLPVISTDLQGVRDYVCADCAVLTPGGDAAALATAAWDAREGRLDLPTMGAASRGAAQRLSWPRVAQAMQRVYQVVADGGEDAAGHAAPNAGADAGAGRP
jgi:glycosyltransferase involved in cell wall biosynthesis